MRPASTAAMGGWGCSTGSVADNWSSLELLSLLLFELGYIASPLGGRTPGSPLWGTNVSDLFLRFGGGGEMCRIKLEGVGLSKSRDSINAVLEILKRGLREKATCLFACNGSTNQISIEEWRIEQLPGRRRVTCSKCTPLRSRRILGC
jgi:hypothetical protein